MNNAKKIQEEIFLQIFPAKTAAVNIHPSRIGPPVARRLTGRIFVDDGDRLPLVVLHNVQHGSADGGVLGVEVDVEAVLVVHGRVFPARLDVRDLQGVADGLHRADRGAVGGAEHGADAQSQLVARWGGEGRKKGDKTGSEMQECAYKNCLFLCVPQNRANFSSLT